MMKVTDKLIRRFFKKVIVADGCWRWIGAKHRDGYGLIFFEGRQRLAHRISWQIANGGLDITPDQMVLHSCDNPPCVNPDHLRLGDKADNARDASERKRYRDRRGENNANARLSLSDVIDIRSLGGWMTQQSLADAYGVKQAAISKILRGARWSRALED